MKLRLYVRDALVEALKNEDYSEATELFFMLCDLVGDPCAPQKYEILPSSQGDEAS